MSNEPVVTRDNLTPDARELVEKRALARRMIDLQLADELVADILDLPTKTVRAIRTYRVQTELVPEDEELADAVRKIVRRGLEKAWWFVNYGSNDQQYKMAHLIVNRSAALIGMQTTTRVDELRSELFQLGQQMTHDTELTTDDEYDNAEVVPGTFAFNPHDTD